MKVLCASCSFTTCTTRWRLCTCSSGALIEGLGPQEPIIHQLQYFDNAKTYCSQWRQRQYNKYWTATYHNWVGILQMAESGTCKWCLAAIENQQCLHGTWHSKLWIVQQSKQESNGKRLTFLATEVESVSHSNVKWLTDSNNLSSTLMSWNDGQHLQMYSPSF